MKYERNFTSKCIYQKLVALLTSTSLINKLIGISTDGEKAIASQKMEW